MCLAIPGRVLSIGDDALRTARVAFGGVVKKVCLVFTPEAEVGEYVVVHAGFAIGRLDETEATRALTYLAQIGDLSALGEAARVGRGESGYLG